ncbi:MAG: hypothetical protein WAV11_01715 [Minisyncoccia bacterium]
MEENKVNLVAREQNEVKVDNLVHVEENNITNNALIFLLIGTLSVVVFIIVFTTLRNDIVASTLSLILTFVVGGILYGVNRLVLRYSFKRYFLYIFFIPVLLIILQISFFVIGIPISRIGQSLSHEGRGIVFILYSFASIVFSVIVTILVHIITAIYKYYIIDRNKEDLKRNILLFIVYAILFTGGLYLLYSYLR